MLVLGCDTSLHRSGLALLDEGRLVGYWVIVPPEKAPRWQQLSHIYRQTVVILATARPDVVAIESSESWQREGHDASKTIAALAQARGAMQLAVTETMAPLPIIREVDVHVVREGVCRNRTASKEQVQAALGQLGYDLPTHMVRELVGGETVERVTRNGKKRKVRVGGHYEVREKVDEDLADAVATARFVWAEERLKGLAAPSDLPISRKKLQRGRRGNG